ncbi:MAG: ATP-binding protein [Geobacteraceae bacterium]|nr:ATP-binding protein [Geobacteraceae bacterium]
MKILPSNQKFPHLYVFIVVIISTIFAGWLFTNYLGRVADKIFKERADRESRIIGSLLNESLGDVENAAMALSHADQLVAALSSANSADLKRANKLLDRVNSGLKLSVCYLLDENGRAVASSNRKEKNGFVGKNFAFRPYFTGAMSGRLTTYFALGTTSNERGYYAAAPVVNKGGAIAGVIVTKRDVASVGKILSQYTNAFLVSPEGIIFISSKGEYLFRSLWPVDEKNCAKILVSRQFGKVTFEPLLAAEPQTGNFVLFENKNSYILRLPFGHDGWTLVTTQQPRIITTYRLFGLLLTTMFALLFLFFFNVLLNKSRSLEAARDLLKSRDDWKRTFDAVPDLIAIVDANYRISSMNRAMAERLGISPQEAIGRRCHELLHDSQEPPSSCPHQRMLQSGTTESETVFIKALNGDFIISVAPLMSKEGTMESSIHVMHDISKIRLLEKSQKEYAQRLEFVLEGSNDATWEWDMITNQNILNKRYYEMIEHNPGEVDPTFEFFLKTIHPGDVADVRRHVQDYLDGKTNVYEAHYRMVTKSGNMKNVMGRGKIVRYDEEGHPLRMSGVVTDVSEMKRLSDEVNRINNLESIGLLSGGLAHDFNNVLNIIYGNISFVKMLAEGNAAIIEPLRDAEEACERAKELGIRLQAFSQGDTPFREPIELTALLEDVTGALFKGSRISHSISAPDAPFPLEADPRQIRQIFENLLTNAKDAMLEGGTVKIDIENSEVDAKKGLSIKPGSYVCITIQDDGTGIPEANLPKIFDPYFSTKDTYSQRGMGLGLSICYAIMKRHNGQITVESTVGIGTSVILYLPVSVD